MSSTPPGESGPFSARPEAAIWLGIMWLALLWTLAIALAGRVSIDLGPLVIRAHSIAPSAIVAALCLGLALRRGVGPIARAVAWWERRLTERAAPIAVGLSLCALGIGAVWGSHVAGGSDSYCYLHQGELFAAGRVRDEQPLAREVPWPNAVRTLAALSQVPAADGSAATVPACPPGYPLMLALARWIGGRPGMFAVVPLSGAVVVWCTFLIGRLLAGPVAGIVAALLLVVSPVFLYQVVQPMTDVPATALWLAAILTSVRASTSTRAAVWSGLLTGIAFLVRPNLVPLGMVPLWLAVARDGTWSTKRAVATAVRFGVVSAPAVVVLLAISRAMHGGTVDSGYGRMDDLFALSRIPGNLSRYLGWLVGSETPVILLGLAAPFVLARGSDARRLAGALIAVGAITLACYLPYVQWDAWWFVRFLLPALPGLCALTAAVAITVVSPTRGRPTAMATGTPSGRGAAVVAATSLLAVLLVVIAWERAAFQLRDLEARYRVVGEYIARTLPPDAVVFADVESGSVRFYSGRVTVYTAVLDPEWLDRAVAYMEARGRRPYLVLEAIEEADFRAKFGPSSRLGALDWPPMADFNREVRIYDPAGYAAYRAGSKMPTDYIFPKR